MTTVEETSPETLQFRTGDGLVLAADRRGDPSGPLVLFLHGGGQTRHAWGGTAEALARGGWHTITLDLRGHGESDWAPDGDYTVRAFAADVLAVIDALGTRPALVGASLGGLTSLLLEGELAPGSARAIVLVDVVHRVEMDGAMRIAEFMTAHPDGFASLEEGAEAIAAYNPIRTRSVNVASLEKNLRRGPNGRWRWHWDPRFMLGGHGPVEITDSDRLARAARSLHPPTLLVRGRMSDIVSEEGAREFLELCRHAEFVDVSGAGHMVAGDRNDAFTDAVRSFLEREDSPRP